MTWEQELIDDREFYCLEGFKEGFKKSFIESFIKLIQILDDISIDSSNDTASPRNDEGKKEDDGMMTPEEKLELKMAMRIQGIKEDDNMITPEKKLELEREIRYLHNFREGFKEGFKEGFLETSKKFAEQLGISVKQLYSLKRENIRLNQKPSP